eukprot:scaffold36362_cov31-Tisochrysis_lutea.AAC.2
MGKAERQGPHTWTDRTRDHHRLSQEASCAITSRRAGSRRRRALWMECRDSTGLVGVVGAWRHTRIDSTVLVLLATSTERANSGVGEEKGASEPQSDVGGRLNQPLLNEGGTHASRQRLTRCTIERPRDKMQCRMGKMWAIAPTAGGRSTAWPIEDSQRDVGETTLLVDLRQQRCHGTHACRLNRSTSA